MSHEMDEGEASTREGKEEDGIEGTKSHGYNEPVKVWLWRSF